MPTFRSEAAVGIGIIGTLLIVGIQVTLGAISIDEGRVQLDAVATSAVPLLTGVGIRALVWSRASVTRLLGDPDSLTARIAREHGPAALEAVVQAGIRRGQELVDPDRIPRQGR